MIELLSTPELQARLAAAEQRIKAVEALADELDPPARSGKGPPRLETIYAYRIRAAVTGSQ